MKDKVFSYQKHALTCLEPLSKKKILKCLKISFVYSADYPSLKIKFGDIFRHVP